LSLLHRVVLTDSKKKTLRNTGN